MYQALHLLVKHKDVRNPKSWKEPVVTRTEEEALAMIEEFHASLVTGDPGTLQQRFADLASSESHCSSAKKGGDLGQFGCLPCLASVSVALFPLDHHQYRHVASLVLAHAARMLVHSEFLEYFSGGVAI